MKLRKTKAALICFGFAFSSFYAASALAYTRINATTLQSDGSAADTQAAIDAATDGYTVLIAAGTFIWVGSITNHGKGIRIQGAGGGGLLGHSTTALAIGTGSKTFAISATSKIPFAVNQTVRAIYTPQGQNYMQGTVTAYSGTTLTVNVTSFAGSGTYNAWTFSTPASTTIINNYSTNYSIGMVSITESSAASAEISGIHFVEGIAVNGNHLNIFAGGGKPVLVHDMWFSTAAKMGRGIQVFANRGVVYRCSFDSNFYSGNGSGIGNDDEALGFKWEAGDYSWATADTMGMRDTTGLNNFYVEDSYFAGMFAAVHDFDDNARVVWRYNIMDNSGGGSHGQETSIKGVRHYELYNNTYIFDNVGLLAYNVTAYFFIRGGTGVITDNSMPNLISQGWGDKPEIRMIVMGLRRAVNTSYACPTTYPVARQVGQGHNGSTYITDPLYIWNNAGNPAVTINDYDPDECGNNKYSANYIVSGRDYIVGTPKPGYQKYTYPHPLRRDMPQTPTLVVSKNGSGSVTSPSGINCDANNTDCSESYSSSTSVTLTATPLGADTTFTSWTGCTAVAGSPHQCTVSVSGPTYVTATFTTSISSAPSITTQPQSQTVAVGSSATFSVVASGAPAPTYQWKRGNVTLAGATSASYTTPALTLADSGATYSVVVTNTVGSVTSSNATLTVLSKTVDDDFSTTKPGWTLTNPNGGSRLSSSDHLVLNVPAGSSHDCWESTFDCTRLMRSASNADAIYETKIDFDLPVTLGTVQGYGIMLWQDNGNYLRFEYVSTGTTHIWAQKIINGSGSDAISLQPVTLGASNYIRVTKRGSTFILEYSPNGTQWSKAGEFTQAGFVVKQVGLYVRNVYQNPATTARFDYFTIHSVAASSAPRAPANLRVAL